MVYDDEKHDRTEEREKLYVVVKEYVQDFHFKKRQPFELSLFNLVSYFTYKLKIENKNQISLISLSFIFQILKQKLKIGLDIYILFQYYIIVV